MNRYPFITDSMHMFEIYAESLEEACYDAYLINTTAVTVDVEEYFGKALLPHEEEQARWGNGPMPAVLQDDIPF